MQVPDEGHHHHPPRLRRALTLAALVVSPLPSPLAPLSPEPPLSNGAGAARDNVPHRIDSRIAVRVVVDSTGAPFRVVATQRLDVRNVGDYFFTIGAPVLDVARAPGSESDPGLRSEAIVWAGFDPGRRTLAARLTLDPARTRPALPARVEVRAGRRWLVNATAVDVAGYSADAEPASLRRYLDGLRHAVAARRTPATGTAELHSPPRSTTVHVVAPLRVSGTVGGARLNAMLGDRLALPPGRLDLTVSPAAPTIRYAPADSGRSLLAQAIRATLRVARAHQYDAFLGNPDPTGTSRTTYRYVSGARPLASAPRVTQPSGRRWQTVLLVAFGAAAAVAAVAAWARS